MHNLSDIIFIDFPTFTNQESSLVVHDTPFKFSRIFTIKADEKCVRGFHAHKECSQLFIVLEGECKVICDDGSTRKEIVLNKSSQGLLVPPAIWAEQEYRPNTVLMVVADKPYDESEYIRNYEEFIKFRNSK